MSPELNGPGTLEQDWVGSGWFERLPPFSPAVSGGRVVAVSPHPDDETLGAGATLAFFDRAGLDIVLVAVTDGESSHPGRQEGLRRMRPTETAAALAVLGMGHIHTVRCGLPDGAVRDEVLRESLGRLIRRDDVVLAPWDRDGHPDHDACGRVAGELAQAAGATLYQYLVWAWHWAGPTDIPWRRAERLDLDPETAARKRRAVGCFVSQTSGPEPILPPHVLIRLTRNHEVLLRR